MERVHILELTVHHSSNPEKHPRQEQSPPGTARRHPMVAADSFSLFVLVPEFELEPEAVPDPETLLAIVSTTGYGQV